MSVHSTAIVSPRARIAGDVKIGPCSVIDDNVTVGKGTVIGAHCVLTGHTSVGEQCEIFSGAILGARPQDLKFKGEKSFLEIGDRVIIREYCTLNPGTGEGGRTVIGSHTMMMAYAHVAHDCRVGEHCIIANCGTLAGHVVLEDHVLISGLSAVHQFVRVGRLSITGGCSKVVQDIPPFSTCDGHPARVYGLNLIGLRRHGVSADSVRALKRAFRIVFNTGVPPKRAIKDLDPALLSNKEVAYLVDFVSRSSRGLSRSCRTANGSVDADEARV